MSRSPSSKIRLYRIFCCLAIFHAAVLLMGFAVDTTEGGWMNWIHRLWVGMATLWFFWPIILALHVGAAKRRAYISLGVAAVFVCPWFWLYSLILAPPVFGTPMMLSFAPHEIGQYAIWYGVGWIDGTKDVKVGKHRLEAYGFGTETPGAPPLSDQALKRHQIEIEHVAACVVSVRLMGHAAGYNDVMVASMRRTFGDEVIPAAERAEAKRQQDYADAADAGRADAQRDLSRGQLAIEISCRALEGEGEYRQMLGEKFGIELRRVACSALDEADQKAMGHASGYNDVAYVEIERRLGKQAASAAASAFGGTSYERFVEYERFMEEHKRNTNLR